MDKGNDNPRTLLLVDVQWLNVQVDGFVEYMQRRIGRKLDDMDFVRLCVCALLDAGIERADGTVEVGLLDDSADGRLHHAVPADMSGELDGYAYCRDVPSGGRHGGQGRRSPRAGALCQRRPRDRGRA